MIDDALLSVDYDRSNIFLLYFNREKTTETR